MTGDNPQKLMIVPLMSIDSRFSEIKSSVPSLKEKKRCLFVSMSKYGLCCQFPVRKNTPPRLRGIIADTPVPQGDVPLKVKTDPFSVRQSNPSEEYAI